MGCVRGGAAESRREHAAPLLRSHGSRRPFHVATRAAVNGGTGTLSGKQNPRYSIVVRTTEPEQIVDQDDSDQRIIQRVLAGDRDEFTVLITRYSDPLYRHALCMTGSPDVAEDILQLSFIKAYQHLAEVRGRFDAWVFRIVANGCKDWLKNIRRSHLSYDEDDQPSGYATPEEELDRTELRSDLDVALSSLPASLREAFVMKHVEGRSYEEMADLAGNDGRRAEDARASRTRGAAGLTRGEVRLACSTTFNPTASTTAGSVSAPPIRSARSPTARCRSVRRRPPIADAVHAWLDGEAPESSVRRAEWSRDVDFWKRMNEDLERRRRMRTPAHVQGRIMEAIPQHAPQMITPWWRREFVVTPTSCLRRRSDPPGRGRGRDRRRPAPGALILGASNVRAADHHVVGRFAFPGTMSRTAERVSALRSPGNASVVPRSAPRAP